MASKQTHTRKKTARKPSRLNLFIRWLPKFKLWGLYVGKKAVLGAFGTPLLYTFKTAAVSAASEWARSRPEKYELYPLRKNQRFGKGQSKRTYRGDPRRSRG